MKFKAIYFDRDNTITRKNNKIAEWQKQQIESWSGQTYCMDYEKTMKLFDLAGYPKKGLKSVEEEIEFWNRYYVQLLLNEGISEEVEQKGRRLFENIWLKDRELFPEVLEVFSFFKNNGYKIGIISDTSPSLSLTLEAVGLKEYIDCYICSDLVGVMKPDRRIYQAALDALGARAEEAIYVDDYDIEADGARSMGFTAFHIKREGELQSEWEISSLKDIISYVNKY